MPIFKLQCSFLMDSALPRDRMVITPHFDVGSALVDADQLCEDLATALDAWSDGTQEIWVKAYDAQGSPPVFPTGDAIRNPGVVGTSNYPRELACCLSFYGERNLPRQRGRLYIPWVLTGVPPNDKRPPQSGRDKVAALAPIFQGLGGTDVDWCVYSQVNDSMKSVTNWWIDDEWDVQRSRGLRADTRMQGTTSEG